MVYSMTIQVLDSGQTPMNCPKGKSTLNHGGKGSDGNMPNAFLCYSTELGELATQPKNLGSPTGTNHQRSPQMKVTSSLISSAVLVLPPLSPKN